MLFRSRVTMEGHNSKKVLLTVPQGSVLSLTLFLVFINDLICELPQGVKAAMYADDLVVWCVEEHLKIANKKIQKAADNIEA